MARICLHQTVSAVAIAAAMLGTAARAADPPAPGVEQRLADQERQLAEQKVLLERQSAEIERLRGVMDAELGSLRARGAPSSPEAPIATAPGPAPAPTQLAQASPVVGAPVGQAPPEDQTPKVVIASVPEFQGVLTRHHLTLEPQIDYQHGSTNRLVFRGVEIVVGLQIGVIDASNADRNATSAALDVRYGLTDRIELEARVPYLYRADRVSTLSQRDSSLTLTDTLYGKGLGDIEVAARYQFNSGLNGWPIFIAGLRAKTDTGSSPYTIDRDQFGIATKDATGSGFWGVQESLSFLYPSDPVVMFGGISYLEQFSKTINKVIGGALVGKVDPGGSISANAGFGFAVNPRLSFSLGYMHTYVFGTKANLAGVEQQSTSLQVGQFNIGLSFQLTKRLVITNTYSIGTTRDAPDMEVMFRLPIAF